MRSHLLALMTGEVDLRDSARVKSAIWLPHAERMSLSSQDKYSLANLQNK